MSKYKQGHFICDVDGVLLDMVSVACEVLSEDFGRHITPSDIITWDWEYCLSFPADYWTEFWQKVWEREIDPYPGANEFLGTLRGMGFMPIGLSTRPDNWRGLRPLDIAQQAGERDNKKLDLEYTIFVNSHDEKNAKAQQLWPDARFTIEDSPKNARDLGQIHHVQRSMLIDRPWNKGCISLTDDWMRVHSYSHVIQELMNGGLLK